MIGGTIQQVPGEGQAPQMASAGNQDMAVFLTAVAVCSETDPDVVYQVQLPWCPCKDFRYRRARFLAVAQDTATADLFCKHLRTALDRVAGWHRAPEQAAKPQEHAIYVYDTAYGVLTTAGLTGAIAQEMLSSAGLIPVKYSGPPLRGGGEVSVTYDDGMWDITVTGAPEPEPRVYNGVTHQRARTLLAEAGVTNAEAHHALTEAWRTGCAYAGLPGSGSVPVLRDGTGAGSGTRRFTVKLPAWALSFSASPGTRRPGACLSS
jgi:hypothetical protein